MREVYASKFIKKSYITKEEFQWLLEKRHLASLEKRSDQEKWGNLICALTDLRRDRLEEGIICWEVEKFFPSSKGLKFRSDKGTKRRRAA